MSKTRIIQRFSLAIFFSLLVVVLAACGGAPALDRSVGWESPFLAFRR